MKFFCRGNHWFLTKGQLILATPKGKQRGLSRRIIEVLDEQIRQQVYKEILALPIPRTLAVKGGIERIAPTVQRICAESVLKRRNVVDKDAQEPVIVEAKSVE